MSIRPHAVEIFNSRSSGIQNRRAERLSTLLRTGKTGGSDAHAGSEIGNGYTVFQNESMNVDDLIHYIHKGETYGEGRISGKNVILKHHIKTFRLFLKRGKRI